MTMLPPKIKKLPGLRKAQGGKPVTPKKPSMQGKTLYKGGKLMIT